MSFLDGVHDRAGFVSGLDSVDRYLREIARGHMEKGVSVTRVLVEAEATTPRAVLGYFTLSKAQAKKMNKVLDDALNSPDLGKGGSDRCPSPACSRLRLSRPPNTASQTGDADFPR